MQHRSNTAAIVESYLIAKAEVIAVVGGYGFVEGASADLDVALQSRKSLQERALLAFLTQQQIDSCKIEGDGYPVVRIKAKKAKVLA